MTVALGDTSIFPETPDTPAREPVQPTPTGPADDLPATRRLNCRLHLSFSTKPLRVRAELELPAPAPHIGHSWFVTLDHHTPSLALALVHGAQIASEHVLLEMLESQPRSAVVLVELAPSELEPAVVGALCERLINAGRALGYTWQFSYRGKHWPATPMAVPVASSPATRVLYDAQRSARADDPFASILPPIATRRERL